MGMSEMRLALGLSAMVAMLAPVASAADDPPLNCNNAVSQNDMNMCADREYKAADRQLNSAYRKLITHLDVREKALLATAERAWVAFRDKECTYQSSENEGGSIYPLVYTGCLLRLTEARTRELNAYIKERSGQ